MDFPTFSQALTTVVGAALIGGLAACGQGADAAIEKSATSATASKKVLLPPKRTARTARAKPDPAAAKHKLDAVVEDLRTRLAERYRLAHPQALEIGRVLEGHKRVVVHLNVTHRGVPVLGPSVVANARLDRPERMRPFATLLPLPRKVALPETKPKISAEEATRVVAALERKAPRKPRVQQLAIVARTGNKSRRGHYRPKPRIVGYNLAYIVHGWKAHYRVDAHTGKLLGKGSVLVQ